MSETASAPLAVENLWKVFGPRLDDAISAAEAGASRAEIMERVGTTIAVRNVSFQVQRGETFVVMGLSGSGKSTLIRCVSRLIEPSRGRVMVDGEDLLAADPERLREIRRHKMSMVFQHFGLFPHRHVIDNVAYGLEVQGLPRAERHAKAREVLKTVGLEGWEHHYPQQLSGGMQQRVGLARALVLDPDILFFDEPFSALDPLIRRDMQDELVALQSDWHCTIVFITHDFAEALKLGDHIAIMKDGSFDQIGTPEEIVANPATDYVREFTKDVPKSKVLTAGTLMSPGRVEGNGHRVNVNAKIETLLPLLLDRDEPLTVVDDDGREVGVIGRAAIVRMLEGEGG